MYLAPANVNFSAVTIQEEAVDPIYGTTIDIIGTGVYNGRIPHGTSVSLSMSSNVDDQLGTKGSINPFDHVEFNPSSFLGITSTAMGEGQAEGYIPNDWKCGGSGWNYGFYTSHQKGTSIAASGSSGVYQLHAEKCSATYDCLSSDPTQTKP